MKLSNNQISDLGFIINQKIGEKTLPISSTLIQLKKELAPLLETFEEDKIAIVEKYAIKNDKGAILGRQDENGDRIQVQQFTDIDFGDNATKAFDDLNALLLKEVKLKTSAVDCSQEVYHEELKEKVKISSVLQERLSFNILDALAQLGVIENL